MAALIFVKFGRKEAVYQGNIKVIENRRNAVSRLRNAAIIIIRVLYIVVINYWAMRQDNRRINIGISPTEHVTSTYSKWDYYIMHEQFHSLVERRPT